MMFQLSLDSFGVRAKLSSCHVLTFKGSKSPEVLVESRNLEIPYEELKQKTTDPAGFLSQCRKTCPSLPSTFRFKIQKHEGTLRWGYSSSHILQKAKTQAVSFQSSYWSSFDIQ